MKSKIVFVFVFVFFLSPILSYAQSKEIADEKTKEQEAERLKGKRIISIEFVGNKVFSEQELLDALQETDSKGQKESALINTTYDADWVDYHLQYTLRKFLWKLGYLKAKVGDAKVKDLEHGLQLHISIEEGVLYRIGKIEVEGARSFSKLEIIEKFQINPSEIANGEKISKVIYEALDKSGCEKIPCGYSAEIEPIFRDIENKPNEGLVDLTIHVDENVVFIVRRVCFAGNEYTRDFTLRREMLLQEGDIFVFSKIRESINRLNSLGLFELIDADKDVEYSFENSFADSESTDTTSNKPKLKYQENDSAEISEPSEKYVDFTVKVREKPGIENIVYYIRSIKFSSEEEIPEKKLRKLLLIKEGDVFNEEMLEASLKKLNASRLVTEVDRYNNVRVELPRKENRTNPNRFELDITIFVEKVSNATNEI